MSYTFRKATFPEAEIVFQLIADRVHWMDEKKIHQWNDTDYLNVYPLSYYQQHLHELYVLVQDEVIIGAAILKSEDERWNTSEPSYYIHNFVSALSFPGAGKLFMEHLEVQAKEEGIAYLRLDSADDNTMLAAYYEKLGFEPCGVCQDGLYHGILRQKKL